MSEQVEKGINAYMRDDYEEAVEILSAACIELVEKHKSDVHESLGPAYLHYGKALLANYKEQAKTLGADTLKRVSECADALEEPVAGSSTVQEADSEKKSSENQTEKAAEAADAPAGSSAKEGSSDSEDDEEEKGEADSDEGNAEDPHFDLEVAWEVLELARLIFKREGDARGLTQTLMALAEVSMENDHPETAIDDINEAVTLMKQNAMPERLAEAYFTLGLAYLQNDKAAEAREHWGNCVAVCEEVLASQDPASLAVLRSTLILAQTKNRLEEIAEYMQQDKPEVIKAIAAYKSSEEEEGEEDVPSSALVDANPAKPASNISHLVKRKRKLDEGAAANAATPPSE